MRVLWLTLALPSSSKLSAPSSVYHTLFHLSFRRTRARTHVPATYTRDTNVHVSHASACVRPQATLVAELASRLLQRHGPGLQRCGAVVSELDCLLGLAAMAAAGGAAGAGRPYCRPELTEGGELYIVNGGLDRRQRSWV